MATKRIVSGETPPPRRPSATTPEKREQQLVGLAYDLVETRLRDGSATAAETTHFLRLGSLKEKKELRKMDLEAQLVQKKIGQVESAERMEQLHEKAIQSMRTYAAVEDVIVD